MAFPSIHRPDLIAFPGSVYIKQITQFSPNRQYNLYREKSAAAPAPQFSGVDDAAPMVEGACRDLKSILDLLIASGSSGICIGYSPTNTGTISCYYRKGANRGIRTPRATAEHDRFDLANTGFFYWRSLEAQQGANQRAELQWTLKALSNDGTNPMVHTGSAALVGTETVEYVYGLGPVKVNGSWLDSVQRSRMDLQIRADQDQGSDGWAYKLYADVDDFAPLATIESNDITLMDTFEEPVAISSFQMYFRRLAKNGLPYPDASAVHIRLSATAGTAVAMEGSGMRGQFTLHCALDKQDDATDPFTINTAVAIA
jgi:hypothetical protein